MSHCDASHSPPPPHSHLIIRNGGGEVLLTQKFNCSCLWGRLVCPFGDPVVISMRAFKLAFAWSFALAALAALRLALHLVPTHSLGFSNDIYAAITAALPLTLAAIFAAAFWTTFERLPAARSCALTASAIPALFGSVLVLRHPSPILGLPWLTLAAGLSGLLLFARHETAAPASTPKPVPAPPIPGDGTNAFVNRFIPLAGVAGALGGSYLWSHFASSHGLATIHTHAIYLQFLAAVLCVLFLHEAGHALGGILLRMKLIGFVVGPFRWAFDNGAWQFDFRPATLFNFAGGTAVVPTAMDNFRRRKIAQVAAGPIVSLLTGAIAAFLVLHAPGHAWAPAWRALSYFATISFVVGLLNFIPFKMGSGYSDGAKLFQLRSEGVWADYHRLLGFIHSTKVAPFSHDVATLHQAADAFARQRPATAAHRRALHLLARSLRDSLPTPTP